MFLIDDALFFNKVESLDDHMIEDTIVNMFKAKRLIFISKPIILFYGSLKVDCLLNEMCELSFFYSTFFYNP